MITVFYGEDTYRSREAYRAAREDAQQQAGTPATMLRDEQLTPATLQVALQGSTLFGTHPPVAVERLTSFTGQQASAIAELLAAVPNDVPVLMWEDGVPAANGIVWRALQAHATLKTFPLSEEAEIQAWVEQHVRSAGCMIDPEARQELLARCGDNMWCVAAELDKLLLFQPTGTLAVNTVKEVVPPNAATDTFAAVRALVRGQQKDALQLLAAASRGDEPRRIFFWVMRELSALLHVRRQLDTGHRLTAWDLVRELHIPKTAAEALLATAQRSSMSATRLFFNRGVAAYYHINTGRAEPEEILENLVFTLKRS